MPSGYSQGSNEVITTFNYYTIQKPASEGETSLSRRLRLRETKTYHRGTESAEVETKTRKKSLLVSSSEPSVPLW